MFKNIFSFISLLLILPFFLMSNENVVVSEEINALPQVKQVEAKNIRSKYRAKRNAKRKAKFKTQTLKVSQELSKQDQKSTKRRKTLKYDLAGKPFVHVEPENSMDLASKTNPNEEKSATPQEIPVALEVLSTVSSEEQKDISIIPENLELNNSLVTIEENIVSAPSETTHQEPIANESSPEQIAINETASQDAIDLQIEQPVVIQELINETPIAEESISESTLSDISNEPIEKNIEEQPIAETTTTLEEPIASEISIQEPVSEKQEIAAAEEPAKEAVVETREIEIVETSPVVLEESANSSIEQAIKETANTEQVVNDIATEQPVEELANSSIEQINETVSVSTEQIVNDTASISTEKAVEEIAATEQAIEDTVSISIEQTIEELANNSIAVEEPSVINDQVADAVTTQEPVANSEIQIITESPVEQPVANEVSAEEFVQTLVDPNIKPQIEVAKEEFVPVIENKQEEILAEQKIEHTDISPITIEQEQPSEKLIPFENDFIITNQTNLPNYSPTAKVETESKPETIAAIKEVVKENIVPIEQVIETKPAASVDLLKKNISINLGQAFLNAPIIYSILLSLSVIALGVWLFTLFTIRKDSIMPVFLTKAIRQSLENHDYDEALLICDKSEALFSKMISRGIEARSYGPQVVLDSIRDEGKKGSVTIWQRINLLNDIAILAPMVGLLGTVIGMFYAFYDTHRSTESVSKLFDGFGISVGTTVAGLAVAISAAIFHSIVKYQTINVLTQAENEAHDLVKFIDNKPEKL